MRVGITKATVCLFNVISWMSVHRTAGHPSGKTLLLASLSIRSFGGKRGRMEGKKGA